VGGEGRGPGSGVAEGSRHWVSSSHAVTGPPKLGQYPDRDETLAFGALLRNVQAADTPGAQFPLLLSQRCRTH
jgi:hypothetical protein